jgi:hypothetical protein
MGEPGKRNTQVNNHQRSDGLQEDTTHLPDPARQTRDPLFSHPETGVRLSGDELAKKEGKERD